MIFSKGTKYRLGARIKDIGECIGHIKLFGISIFRFISDPVIALGSAIRISVIDTPIGEM